MAARTDGERGGADSGGARDRSTRAGGDGDGADGSGATATCATQLRTAEQLGATVRAPVLLVGVPVRGGVIPTARSEFRISLLF